MLCCKCVHFSYGQHGVIIEYLCLCPSCNGLDVSPDDDRNCWNFKGREVVQQNESISEDI